MDMWEWSTADGGNLRQYTRTDAVNQQFQFVDVGAGYYQLKNRNSGKVIAVPSATDGAQVIQTTASTDTKQHFAVKDSAGGYVRFISRHSGKALDLWEWSVADGGIVAQYADLDGYNQQWQMVKVGSVTTTPPTTPSTTPTVAADGTGTYSTVQAAINAVPTNNTTRRVITIKAGTYREIVTIPANKPYITLQGLGSSPSQVNIINNHGANNYGTFNSATVFINGHDFTATNLQFANDFDETNAGSGTQAVAVNDAADRSTFNNVRFIGDQDTLLVNSGARSYFVNSYIEGTVDFIFGDGTAVFNNCSIYEKRSTGGPLTAARTPSTQTYGFLIYRSTITGAVAGKTQLGRPWGPAAQVVYRESNLSNTIATSQPWIDMSGNPWQNARFYEYKNTGAGATVNSNRRQMSDSMAANYTPQKYLAGSDGWNPM
jgi:pectin methylesterase-like acyl-CoA thioesterase